MTPPESRRAPETIELLPGDNTATEHWPGPTPGSRPVHVPGYEILGELGRGGMGVVYKARQIAVQRTVALKMILAADMAEYHERFRAEAEAAAHLQHPNIVQLYEFGEADGRPFFSLEFIAGGSLEDCLRGLPQPIDESARLVAQCAEAMQYAHERGVIHRDLKPANVLLKTADLRPGDEKSEISILQTAIPKIADFGLAKRLDMAGQTGTGMALGTPSYMSPEQAAGNSRNVGPATDVYALGAILYECVTGRPPFRGGNALETMLQVAHEEPVAPRRLRPEVPRDLETICLRCLAKDADKRYSSAQALADDLHRFLEREPIAARPASTWEKARVWAKRHPALSVFLTALTVLAVFIPAVGIKHTLEVQAEHRKGQQQLVRRTVATGNKLTGDGDYLWSLPWFTDALQAENEPERIPAHRIRIGALLRLCPTLLQVWPYESPVLDACVRGDGQVIATARDDGSVCLWSLQRLTDPARLLRTPQPGSHGQPDPMSPRMLSFSPDGRWLVARLADGIWCFETTPGVDRARRIGDTAVRFAWGKQNDLVLANEIMVWRLDPNDDKMTMKTPETVAGRVAALAVSAANDGIAIGTQDGAVYVRTDLAWEPVGEPVREAKLIQSLCFSPDGKRLIAVKDTGARVIDAAKRRIITPWLAHSGPISDAAFSPDGQWVATASLDDTAKIWNAETGELKFDPLKHNSDVFRVAFSPDSKLLATCSDDATARVWNVATGQSHSPPLPHSGTVNAVAFTNAGHTLQTASEDGTIKLWALGPPRDVVRVSIHNGELSKRVKSADGHFEVVSSDAGIFKGALGEFRVIDTKRGQWQVPGIVHPGGALCVAFNPDASRIVTGGNDRTTRIWDWREAREAAPALRHGSRIRDVMFSGDGRFVATASDDNSARVWNAESGAAITPPLWHNGTVQSVRFNLDGSLVVTASKGELAYVWDIATGEEIAPVRISEPWVKQAFGSRVPIGPWNLPADERPIEELVNLAEWLSGHRVDATGGLVPLSDEEYRKVGERVRAAKTSGR